MAEESVVVVQGILVDSSVILSADAAETGTKEVEDGS